MNNSPPKNATAFGHHTVSLRAHFAPGGAAPAITKSTVLAGPSQVMIPAALVPEGISTPGYPYEHIAQAMFTPDQEDNSTRTGLQQPRSAETPMGMQRSTPMPGNTPQSAAASASARQSAAPAASDAGSNSETATPTPRRSVRRAQANFSAAAPQPHLDNSSDAIEAAVRALHPDDV
jgi:hypothetical protein